MRRTHQSQVCMKDLRCIKTQRSCILRGGGNGSSQAEKISRLQAFVHIGGERFLK